MQLISNHRQMEEQMNEQETMTYKHIKEEKKQKKQ